MTKWSSMKVPVWGSEFLGPNHISATDEFLGWFLPMAKYKIWNTGKCFFFFFSFGDYYVGLLSLIFLTERRDESNGPQCVYENDAWLKHKESEYGDLITFIFLLAGIFHKDPCCFVMNVNKMKPEYFKVYNELLSVSDEMIHWSKSVNRMPGQSVLWRNRWWGPKRAWVLIMFKTKIPQIPRAK